MAKEKKEEVVTLDVQPFLLPIAILLSAVIFSISFIVGMNALANATDGTSGSTAKKDNDTVEPVAANPSSGLTVSDLADAVGADVGDFEKCYDEKKFADEVSSDLADGAESGVTGTPGFVIGRVNGTNVEGVLVVGAQPYTVFEEVIQAAVDNNLDSLDSGLYPTASTTIDDDPINGDKGSKVAVVEFSDLECPFCKRHHTDTYPQIISNFVDNGESMYVFRDYPLGFHDPVATDAAVAAQCVFDLEGDDAYYAFIDTYFENTQANGVGL